MEFNLEYYKAFYYVAKHGSTSKASEILNISQPAISQTIKKLETEFGCRLFDRTAKGMKLTKEGMVLYNHASVAMEELAIGEKKIEKLSHFEAGEIVIGSGDTALYHFLLPKIKKFSEEYPNVNVSVISDTTPILLDMLKKGNVDLAFVLTHLEEIEHIDLKPLRDFKDAIISSESFSELKGVEVDAVTLSHYPIVTLGKSSSMRTYFESWFKSQGLEFVPDYIVSTTDLIIPFVMNGLGIGIIPEEFAEEGIANGEIFKLNVKKMPPKRHLYIATDKRAPLSALSQKFIQSLDQ